MDLDTRDVQLEETSETERDNCVRRPGIEARKSESRRQTRSAMAASAAKTRKRAAAHDKPRAQAPSGDSLASGDP